MLLKLTLSLAVFAALLCCLSCGKDHDDNKPVVNKDTLSAGWIVAQTPSQPTIIDIAFANNTTGYAITSAQEVWKSVDGGLSWSVAAQLPDSFSANNIAVTKNGKVFITPATRASSHGIYKSTDGVQFTYQYVGLLYVSRGGEDDIVFTGNDTGYISSAASRNSLSVPDGVLQTTDGGASWHFVATGNQLLNYYHNMSFYENAGYIANGKAVLYTAGRYNQWDSTTTFSSPVISMSAVSASVAYAVALGGIVYKTTNGGASFAQVGTLGNLPKPDGYFSIRFWDEQNGFVSIGHQVFETTDGGQSWSAKVNLNTSSLIEVYTSDATHSWVCGDNGTILVYKP